MATEAAGLFDPGSKVRRNRSLAVLLVGFALLILAVLATLWLVRGEGEHQDSLGPAILKAGGGRKAG